MRGLTSSLFVVAGCLFTQAHAQTLTPIEFEGIASVFFEDNGKVNACGLRFYGVEEVPGRTVVFRSVEVSLLIGADAFEKGVGMVKAFSMETNAADIQAGKSPRPIKLRDGWMRAPKGQRTTPYQGRKIENPESPTAVLYLTSFETLLEVLTAALEGQEIQVGVSRQGSAVNPVYYGKVTMSDSHVKQHISCMEDLVANPKAGK